MLLCGLPCVLPFVCFFDLCFWKIKLYLDLLFCQRLPEIPWQYNFIWFMKAWWRGIKYANQQKITYATYHCWSGKKNQWSRKCWDSVHIYPSRTTDLFYSTYDSSWKCDQLSQHTPDNLYIIPILDQVLKRQIQLFQAQPVPSNYGCIAGHCLCESGCINGLWKENNAIL